MDRVAAMLILLGVLVVRTGTTNTTQSIASHRIASHRMVQLEQTTVLQNHLTATLHVSRRAWFS